MRAIKDYFSNSILTTFLISSFFNLFILLLLRRRYEQAEKEFIAAKIELHEKSELKKQLTEHLYTIIHQNELRKAQKLDKLTSQLDSNISKDDVKGAELENVCLKSTITILLIFINRYQGFD